MSYFEILFLIIPAILVFLAIYLLMKQFFDNQLKLRMAKQRESVQGSLTPLKIQAYERLMLFCERISIPNLLIRLRENGMAPQTLKATMIMAVQQEYEHNVSQQLYVSDKLWQIIQLAKNQIIETIALIGEKHRKSEDAASFANELIEFVESQEKDPLNTAKFAIRREAGLLL